MTAIIKSRVKKTGYADIDRILLNSHDLLKQSAQLQKDIKAALQKEDETPPSSLRKKGVRYRINN